MDFLRQKIRSFIRVIAKKLNKISNGSISPDFVTIIGLVAHLPIAWLIATQNNYWAAGLLVIFGLFDTLDGELARLQNKASDRGMLLDATTDRMKEILLYTGAAYALVDTGHPYMTTWVILACGGSLLVSYVKAKGETIMANSGLSTNAINRLFQDGLMRFEVRMVILILGLLLNSLTVAIVIIATTTWFTAIQRLHNISQKIK